MGRQAHAVSADVADDEAVERAAQEIESALGPIELWVNSAFTGAIAFFGDVRPEEYRRITDVTYMGFVNGTHAALKRMQPRNRGRVIQVGSALAFRGIPLQSAYCGAKHAIKGFTESVRVELKHQGCKVRLCDIHMPGVNTPQFDWVLHRGVDHHRMPVPPIYRPEVCARAIVHVAEHPRRTMWVGLPTALTILGNRVRAGAAGLVPGQDQRQGPAVARPRLAGAAAQHLGAGVRSRGRRARQLRRRGPHPQPRAVG